MNVIIAKKPYTYHQHQRVYAAIIVVHKTVPMQCGHCGSTHLVTTGLGTEQLEETLKARFHNIILLASIVIALHEKAS